MRTSWIVVAILASVSAGLLIATQYRSPSSVEPPLSVVETLPDFTLPDLNDQPRSVTEWSGRSLIINFWATWCAPCRREMPLLQSLQDEHDEDSLQVIGVAMDNRADAQRFITETGVTYPILYGVDEAAMVAESFGDEFVGLPFTAFIVPGGEILTLLSGELDAADLRELAGEMDAIASGQSSVAEARKRLLAN
jgi:thiol-disulfide isomerase/thioredoxin